MDQPHIDKKPFLVRWQEMTTKQLYKERDEIKRRIDLLESSDSVRDTLIEIYNEIQRYVAMRLEQVKQKRLSE